MGEASESGGPNGDLYVIVKVKDHAIFERDEMDIMCEIPIKFTTAALGGEVEVPTLKGKKIIKIPAGTQTGKSFRMRGEGLPALRGSMVGDEIVKVVVETPIDLNEKQRELLRAFEDSLKDKNYTKHKTWLDKVKAFFK